MARIGHALVIRDAAVPLGEDLHHQVRRPLVANRRRSFEMKNRSGSTTSPAQNHVQRSREHLAQAALDVGRVRST